jgi:TolB-like protein/Flp pilus assembly protein TadD
MTENSSTQAIPGRDVFISYASQDKAVAETVCKALESAGVACWIAPRDVTPGEFYAESIVHAIDSAKVVALVLSQNAAESQHVLREVERASSKRHPVVSFRIDLAPLPAALEYFLNTSQWLDASAVGFERALPKLVDAVRSAVAQPLTGPRVDPVPAASSRASPGPRRMHVALAAIIAAALGFVMVKEVWLPRHAGLEQPTLAAAQIVSDKSIAVLPFLNMSSDKEQEYFSDGLSEELLNLLTKVPQLQVAARTSSFYYKGKEVKLAEIARELHVAHLLEGSVRKSGNRVRITAQLIRATDGYQQWSQSYDRTLKDIFAVQEEIAAAVVTQLRVTLLGVAPKAKATDPKAYDLFLQGRQLSHQKTPEGYTHAITLYEQVLAIDPGYAAAWSGLSDIYIGQITEGLRPVAEGCRLSREAASKALALDPDMASAHAQSGWIAMNCDYELAIAAQHMARALTLAPEDIDVLHNATILAWGLGRLDTAIAIGESEVARDPVNGLAYDSLGDSYCFAGRQDACLASYRTALALNPGYLGSHSGIGFLLLEKGESEAALTEIQQETAERWRLSNLSFAYYTLGRKADSDAALAELIKKYEKQWPYGIAMLLASRRETDRAFDFLEQAAAGHEPLLFQILIAPAFVKLHNDPRWLPFLRRIGRAPEQLATIKFDVQLPKRS